MSELKANMAKVAAKYHQQMRSQLTEEQRIKFDEFRGRMHENWGNRMGNAGFGNLRHRG
jgi:hypothetical protein